MTTHSTGSEPLDQLLKFTKRAKELGVVSFKVTSTYGTVPCHTLEAHLLPEPPTPEEQKKQDARDLYGAG